MLVSDVRKRTSNSLPSWPSVKFRFVLLLEIVTIRAGPSWFNLSVLNQASTVNSPVRRTASIILVAGLSDRISVCPRTSSDPSARRKFLRFSILKSRGCPTPARYFTEPPLTKLKSYSASKPSVLRSAAHAPSDPAKPARNKDTISWLKKVLTCLILSDVPTYYDSVFHCVLTFFHFTEPPIVTAIS